MKKFLFVFGSIAAAMQVHSQCTPNPQTGTPGLTPDPSSVPCIERGVFYDYTMYFENFDTITCSIFGSLTNFTVVSATIDSMTNFPCGITWAADKFLYGSGETGCIRVYGTTTDSVGEYPLNVYMTFVLMDSTGAQQSLSGTLYNLVQQSQSVCTIPLIDVYYVSRVIDQGTSCLSIGSLPQQTSSGFNCATLLFATISGDDTICAGLPANLNVNVNNATGPVSYVWTPGGDTSSSVTVYPSVTTTYFVTVSDQTGFTTAAFTVHVEQVPTAAFTVTPSGRSAVITNTSTFATSYLWTFGDGQSSTMTNPPPHHYVNNGTYTVNLDVTGNCGVADSNAQVTISAPPSPCTPDAPTGTPGILPDPDGVPCIERGVPYDFTMQLENYDTVVLPGGYGTIDSMAIDSIGNFPCGITWQASKLHLMGGETGCIKVSGTTYSDVGQYPLKVYISIYSSQLFFIPSGKLDSLAALVGDSVDRRYISRVINPGNGCPPRDTAANAVVQPAPLFITEQCAGAGAELQATPGFAQYDWSTGATTSSIRVTSTGPYTLDAMDSAGCAANAVHQVTGFPVAPAEICIVGVDSVSGKNIIVWEKPVTTAIDSYVVYRETNQTNVYARIGAQAYGAFSTFTDLQSVPEQNSNSYKLGIIDTCGITSEGLLHHKTIHLSINQGVGNTWNLSWTHYEGFSFNTYNIYRGTAPGNLTQINSVASNVDAYTDLNPPAGNVIYYQIEVRNPNTCTPTAKQTDFSVSRSNVVSTPFDGIGVVRGEKLNMHPNPFSGSFIIEVPAAADGPFELSVLDVAGRKLMHAENITTREYLLEWNALPKGVFYVELRGVGGVYRGKVVAL